MFLSEYLNISVILSDTADFTQSLQSVDFTTVCFHLHDLQTFTAVMWNYAFYTLCCRINDINILLHNDKA